jgi:cytochrome c556
MAQWRITLFLIVALLASTVPAGPQERVEPQPMPVLDNVDLMDLMVKPAYDVLRQTASHPPADRQAWAALYQHAARLAELENLLFFRTRAGQGRQAEWSDHAARARDASSAVAASALLGLRSARAADFDRVRDAWPAVAAACTACHRAFAREAPVIQP